MSKVWHKYGELVISGSVTFVIALLIFFGMRPLHEQLVIGQTEIAKIQITQEIQFQRVFRRSSWQDDLDLIVQNEQLLNIFAHEQDIVTIVEDLEEIATIHNVRVKFTVPADNRTLSTKKDTKSKSKTLTVLAEGQFANVTTFLSLVEKYRYQAQISNVSMSFIPPKSKPSRVIGAPQKSPKEELPVKDVNLTFDATFDIEETVQSKVDEVEK